MQTNRIKMHPIQYISKIKRYKKCNHTQPTLTSSIHLTLFNSQAARTFFFINTAISSLIIIIISIYPSHTATSSLTIIISIYPSHTPTSSLIIINNTHTYNRPLSTIFQMIQQLLLHPNIIHHSIQIIMSFFSYNNNKYKTINKKNLHIQIL